MTELTSLPALNSGAPRLVLASASPRRKELLGMLGVPFVVVAADIDETPQPDEEAGPYVERLARAKAAAGLAATGALGERVVVAADTVVELAGRLLGKPSGPEEAAAMLAALSGQRHRVWTGVAVVAAGSDPQVAAVRVVATEVWFSPLTAHDIAAYVASGEPLDKAGAYALQGIGGLLVERVSGSVSNVIGLPMAELRGLLADQGVVWRSPDAAPGPRR